MPRVQHPSGRNGTSAPALPVALRDGDFSGQPARHGAQGDPATGTPSPHATPSGMAFLFRQSRRNGATAFGTSPSAAPVGLRLRAAGAGIFFGATSGSVREQAGHADLALAGVVAQVVHQVRVGPLAGSAPQGEAGASTRRSSDRQSTANPSSRHGGSGRVAGSKPAAGISMGLRLCSQEQSPQQSAPQRMKQPTAQSAGARPNGRAKADARDGRRDGTFFGCVRVAAIAASCKLAAPGFVGSSPTASTTHARASSATPSSSLFPTPGARRRAVVGARATFLRRAA